MSIVDENPGLTPEERAEATKQCYIYFPEKTKEETEATLKTVNHRRYVVCIATFVIAILVEWALGWPVTIPTA
jgi:hypothetical protein